MHHLFGGKSAYLIMLLAVVLVSFASFYGCDDAGITEDPVVSYVVHFDSIGVEEFINGQSRSGINLYNGTTVISDSVTKDCHLADSSSTGLNFYLRSGSLLDLILPAGYQSRFNRIYASMTQAEFDTITVLPVNRDTILPDLDFTADDTYGNGAWGYFNIPMGTGDSKPVFSFWLKQKSSEFIGRNVYGIIYPREASDSDPNNPGGYRMSFEVRINTFGLNDFKHGEH